ncbi:MAG: GNAT family N-acetyltransferase [Micrococcales bacterium]|nr:GNAT family N-acetyltransferase [Micrococcales bacterium]
MSSTHSCPTPQPVPVLTDGVVTLRGHSMGDVDAIQEQCRDPEMLRWTTVPRGYTRQDASDFVQHTRDEWASTDAGNRYWAIEAVGGGRPRFVGTIDLRLGESASTAFVGYGLHPAARGRGLMTRAVRLAAGHAFDHGLWGTPVRRIHWRAIVGNWSSRRVAWATGFTAHGTLPETLVNPANRGGPALDAWHASLATGVEMVPGAPWFEPAHLQGNGVRLRPFREEDRDAIEERGDPDHWMPGWSVLRRESFDAWLLRRRTFMAEGQSIEWCVADSATDRALGTVTVLTRGVPMTGDTAELGYQLNPSARGRGVMREAARLAVDFALRPAAEGGLGLRRLVAEAAADNAASNRVLESAGFMLFGREHAVDALPDGSYADALHWELLPGHRQA